MDIQDTDQSDNPAGAEIKVRAAQLFESETFDRWRRLLTLMVNKKECLVHGRLRTQSVLAKDGESKVSYRRRAQFKVP